jgi:hypothetical protein
MARLSVQQSTTNQGHRINFNTCKFGKDLDFRNSASGTIVLKIGERSIIDLASQDEDEDGKLTGVTHVIGEIYAVGKDKTRIDWKQNGHGYTELDRAN